MQGVQSRRSSGEVRRESPTLHRPGTEVAARESRAVSAAQVSNRKSHLKRTYGLTLDEFDALLASQGGGCAVCGLTDADNVDHDHVSGRVRGILCFRCNVAIGQMDDVCDRLIAAMEYLDRHDERAVRERGLALRG